MPKIFSSAKSYCKNIGLHAWSLIRRRETISEAAGRFATDTKKLAHVITGAVKENRANEHDSRKAEKLIKVGRDKFNAKNYAVAEKCFREALHCDPQAGWALTYLGYTLYHMGQSDDALAAWGRAYALDPASEAGLKAMRKIRHVEKVKKEIINTLAERIDRD
jgi:tetratricopeptide (TPR) repeat protein